MVELVGSCSGTADGGRGLEVLGQPVGSFCGKGVSRRGVQVGDSTSGKVLWEGVQQMRGSARRQS